LTVVAADAPLAAVLTEVGRQTGTTFIGLEQVSGAVTIEIRGVRLPEALATLLVDRSYVMTEPADATAPVQVCLEGRGENRVLTEGQTRTRNRGDDPRDRGPTAEGFDPSLPYDLSAAREFRARPSPAEAETARLTAAGFFNPDTPEGTLISAATDADPGVRVRALQTLAIQNTNAARQALRHALEDSNLRVRNEALSTLLSVGDREAGEIMVDLLAHQDPATRLSALLALGDRAGEEVEFQLKRALHDEDSGIREMAARLLQQKKKDR
jgi:hypothetical protein